MTETLGELLRRSADAAPTPHLDVDSLVAEAERRHRRRRIVQVAAGAAVVGAFVVGSLVVRGGVSTDLEPAPAPSRPDSSSSVAVDTAGTRPVVYAEGSTLHVGEDTVDAGGHVVFVDITDDGVLFMTGCDWPRPACTEDTDAEWFSDTLWFNDGSTTVAIGRAPTEHIGIFEVYTENPGSLVVWADATSRVDDMIRRFVVYDTSRREVVATIPYTGFYNDVLHVDDDHVYFNPDNGTPGCWVLDEQSCDDPHLLSYDLASGATTTITQPQLEAEMSTHVQMFDRAAHGRDELGFSDAGSFGQAGRRLVSEYAGDPAPLTRTNGEEIRLRLPGGYTLTDTGAGVSYWLDDEHVVLAAGDSGSDLGNVHGDVLVCPLPDGVCRVARRDVSLVPPR